MANKVTEKMEQLLKEAGNTNVVVGKKSYPLDSPDLPANAAVTFVVAQLQALRPPVQKRDKQPAKVPAGASA